MKMQNKEIKIIHYDGRVNIHHVSCSPVKVLKINNEEFNCPGKKEK